MIARYMELVGIDTDFMGGAALRILEVAAEAFRREQQSTIKVASTFPVLSILQRSDFSAERIKVCQT